MFNWAGLAGIVVFYFAILAVGLWAAWKRKKEMQNAGETNSFFRAPFLLDCAQFFVSIHIECVKDYRIDYVSQ